MSAEAVLFALDGDIATVTLNRPEAGNTVDMALAQGLVDAAIRCEHDPKIRCVVLTGAGKLFCGGGDISAFAQNEGQVPAYLDRLAGTLHLAVSRFMRMAKPLVVLVNGPAAGAGMSLALAGDIVIAADTAHFTAAYGSVGLSPDGGMSWHLPRLVGLRRAQDIIITNRRVSATEAEQIGMVTRTVPLDQLAQVGREQAESLAAAPTQAVAAARSLLLSAFEGPLEAQLEREVRTIVAVAASPDLAEGVAAFSQRRKPNFKGDPSHG